MLRPRPSPAVPVATRRAARRAFPHGHPYLTLRDTFGPLYRDEDFRALYQTTGQPAWSPWRLAVVLVLQHLEGLSDRAAADMVRARLDWKYLLALDLADPGFHYSVLSRFRARLLSAGAEESLLDRLLDRCQTLGLLAGRGRARTDSTHLLANIRSLSRAELVGETLRAALNALARDVPDWLSGWLPGDWWGRYRARIEHRDGRGEAARGLDLVHSGRDGPERVWALPELEVLRRCWLEAFMVVDGEIQPRERPEQPAAGQRLDSPHDPEAHFGAKGNRRWVGYKVHFTETCDEERPQIITLVHSVHATPPDIEHTETVHRHLAERALLPSVHLADAAYVNASLIVSSAREYAVELLGPVHRDSGWQRRSGGYDLSQFRVDWEALTVTCPQGKVSAPGWAATVNGHPGIAFKFAREDCRTCPVSALCVRDATRDPRKLRLRLRDEHETVQRARQRELTWSWQRQYHLRAGIESTFSAAVRACGLRRCRYRGLRRAQLQALLVATALNLTRLANWLGGVPRGRTQVSRLWALRPE